MQDQPPLGQDPEAPDTTRMFITVVLCTVVYVVWSQFFMPRPALPEEGTAEGPVASAPDEAAPTAAPAPAVAATPDLPERRHSVHADVAGQGAASAAVRGGYTAELSSRGAQIVDYQLDGYGDAAHLDEAGARQNIDLVHGGHEGARLFALASRGGDVLLAPGDAWEMTSADQNGARFRRVTSSGVTLERRYVFDAARFGFRHELVLKNDSAAAKRAELDLVFAATEEGQQGGSFFSPSISTFAGTCRTTEDNETFPPTDLEDEDGKLPGEVAYAGLDWQYFLAAAMPEDGTATVGCTAHRFEAPAAEVGQPPSVGVRVALHHAPIDLAPGQSVTLAHTAFQGPKQLGLLGAEGHGLDENIDFGIFGVLSKPILWLLVKLHEGVGNFGIAIILLTLIIKLLTFPLTQKSYVSMQQMKTIAPAMKELQQKYGHDRALLGQKQMDLYKDKGINPMAGCFPMLVQMPIWFALYRTLWSSVELYQQPFFGWITDLSQPDVFPLFGFAALPFVVGALMLFQTVMQPPPQDQPQMKYVMWAMPVMFTFFMFSMPSGLSLYMITNSSLTMAQQLYIKRKYPAPDAD